MFGAHLGDLPDIWEELIDARFESGHAYGKALRTVKSCVDSTWCRFGLHDSVSFAIEVEDRYKGVRAPHKIKGGVSGCVREPRRSRRILASSPPREAGTCTYAETAAQNRNMPNSWHPTSTRKPVLNTLTGS